MTSNTVRGLERGLMVIDLLVARRHVTLPEVAHRLALPRASAFRLLSTLEAGGWVMRHPSQPGYWAGPALLRLRSADLSTWMGDVCEPRLVDLAARSQETANLAVRVGDRLVYERVVFGNNRLRSCVEVGSTVPVHATGLGKAFLAALPADEAARLLGPGPYPRYTDRTHVDRATVLAEVELARERGWGRDAGECEDGSECVAVAVLDQAGEPLGAMSVAGPDARFGGERLRQLIELVTAAAADVRARLALPAPEAATA